MPLDEIRDVETIPEEEFKKEAEEKEIEDVSERLKDEEWANEKVKVPVRGELVETTRGELYRKGMKAIAGDDNPDARLRDRHYTPSQGISPETLLGVIERLSPREKREKKDVIARLKELAADDDLSARDLLLKAVPILESNFSEQLNQLKQESTEKGRENARLRYELREQEERKVVSAELDRQEAEAKKQFTWLKKESLLEATYRIYNDLYDERVIIPAMQEIRAYGIRDPQRRAEILKRHQANAPTVAEAAAEFDNLRKTFNTTLSEMDDRPGLGGGSAGPSRPVKKIPDRLTDKDGNVLVMGTPAFDKRAKELGLF